jgi:hypothetical protein
MIELLIETTQCGDDYGAIQSLFFYLGVLPLLILCCCSQCVLLGYTSSLGDCRWSAHVPVHARPAEEGFVEVKNCVTFFEALCHFTMWLAGSVADRSMDNGD